MEISYRLKEIAKLIKYSPLIDVGTDHGYLPIYSIKNGIVKEAVATDVNKGPLKIARENIRKYGLEDKIELRLGSGISPISEKDGKSLVISGMGGRLIISILEDKKEILNSFSQIILQPQSDIPMVREYIHSIGFKIDNEKFIKDSGKYYTIIDTSKGIDTDYTDIDYLLGKKIIEDNNLIFIEYLEKEIKTNKKIIKEIKSYSKDNEKTIEIEKLNNIYGKLVNNGHKSL